MQCIHPVSYTHLILDRTGILSDRRCQRVQSDRTAAKLFDDRHKNVSIHPIQTERIHIQQVKYNGVITETVAHTALDLMDVDTLGLDRVDRNILVTIIEKFGGGPVGLDTLAASIGEDAGTIEDVYEPYLLMKGLIDRTPRGRVATQIAYTHLGL